MPRRKVPLVTGEFYHVFNRGIDHRPTFTSVAEFKRAVALVGFYHFGHLPLKYSLLASWPKKRQDKFFEALADKKFCLVDILGYCLMTNHFHLLLKQTENGGISRFLSDFQNSYTRYFNLRHERVGPLFLDEFKAVRIETEEQLLHVSRYIHLNPYTGGVLSRLEELTDYPWSSLDQYLVDAAGWCETQTILALFKNRQEYRRFVFNQADYQKQLAAIGHLLIEFP